MQRVVIAPDSFKGSISAVDAAAALARGWRTVAPDDEIVELPQADGGEGTLDAMAAAVAGAQRHETVVTGPDGRPVAAEWLELPGSVAVVEFAQAAGLPRLAVPDAAGATSFGVGELIAAALDHGARSLVIGLGGSATTDGGAGALQALGLRLLDAQGDDLARGGAALAGLAAVDRSGLRPAPGGGVTLLTDVVNPLLGATGAAHVFGPQKGADPEQVALLDAALARWAELLGGDPAAAGAGAAGGAGYGFAAAWGARTSAGSAELARLSGLTAAAASADVLIVGEGRFDETSLNGKVVGHAIGLAGEGTRVIVVAGRVDAASGRAAAIELSALAGSPEAAIADPARWLELAGARAARL